MQIGAHVRHGGGVEFAVWAPERRRVVLEWSSERHQGKVALRRSRDGVWFAFVRAAGAGTRYAYWLDDEGPFPDPYARSLPEGVHGRAEVVDPAWFRWRDGDWRGLCLKGLVLYELHVGTFTREGTFDAVIAHLADLKRLGVTAIQLMPVSSFPGARNWGYDGVGHFAPDVSYGGPEALRRLVDAAHARGLGVILDVVYNHLGPSGNYLRAFSPRYFTDRYTTPWGEALNYGARRVRDWAIDNATHFLREYHVDGLRLDATAEIYDDSRVHLLRELSTRCRASIPRPVVLIAEDDRNDVRLVHSAERGGFGLDAVWADDFHHALRTLLTHERAGYYADYTGEAAELLDTVANGLLYRGQHSSWMERPRGGPTGRTPARAFIYCIENHDQVGNRALGERLSHLISPGQYRAASTLLLLAPATPMLFMGQEFAASTPFQYFTDHERDLGALITAGRRREFGAFPAFAAHPDAIPDPQDPATFDRSKLRHEERDASRGVYRLYRDLLAIRRDDPTIARQDRFALRTAALGPQALALLFEVRGARRLLVVNVGGVLECTVPFRLGRARWRAVFNSDANAYGGSGASARLIRGRLSIPGEMAVLFAPTERGGTTPAP